MFSVKLPKFRTILLATTSVVLLTLLENLDVTHPKEDALEQSVVTKHFRYTATTYHNRHANRCVNIRCGGTETPRTTRKTRCDVLYIVIEEKLGNKSREICGADYISERWDALSRTYNDGIVYIGNDAVLGDVPLYGKKIHFNGRTRITPDWFSMIPFGGGINILRMWIRQGKLDISCEHKAVECHTRVMRYSCENAMNVHSCRSREYGVSVLRAVLVTAALWVAWWRLVSTSRVLRGGRRDVLAVTPVWIPIAVGIIAFAGMKLSDMAWLISRIVGVRFTHMFTNDALREGDIYRQGDIRGIYEGYAYVWRDGEEAIKVAGPGVAIVVGLVSIGLFLKRALLDGILVRCCLGVIGVSAGCGVVEMALRKKGVKFETDEYLPVELARRYAKRVRGDRVFVRGSKR